MPKSLSIYIAGLVTVGALALAITSFVIPVDAQIRLGLFGSEKPRCPRRHRRSGRGLRFSLLPCQSRCLAAPCRHVDCPDRRRDELGRPNGGRMGRAHRYERIPRTLGSSSLVWDAREPCWDSSSQRSSADSYVQAVLAVLNSGGHRDQRQVLDFASTMFGAFVLRAQRELHGRRCLPTHKPVRPSKSCTRTFQSSSRRLPR
jgi:hypothetical protein